MAQPAVPPQRATRKGLLRLLPPTEVLLFLVVGAGNTLFSYVLYVGFVALYSHLFPSVPNVWISDASYACSFPISVTFSFFGFKLFVFKTKGNHLKEWLRCIAVYSVTFPASMIILPTATKLLTLTPLPHKLSTYAAGIINSGIIATYSYFANKKFSFKK